MLSRSFGYPDPLPHFFFSPTSCTCAIGVSSPDDSIQRWLIQVTEQQGRGWKRGDTDVILNRFASRDRHCTQRNRPSIWVIAYQMRMMVVTWHEGHDVVIGCIRISNSFLVNRWWRHDQITIRDDQSGTGDTCFQPTIWFQGSRQLRPALPLPTSLNPVVSYPWGLLIPRSLSRRMTLNRFLRIPR